MQRGTKKFEKTSYKSSYPLRCTSTENLHSCTKAVLDRHNESQKSLTNNSQCRQGYEARQQHTGSQSYSNLRSKSGNRHSPKNSAPQVWQKYIYTQKDGLGKHAGCSRHDAMGRKTSHPNNTRDARDQKHDSPLRAKPREPRHHEPQIISNAHIQEHTRISASRSPESPLRFKNSCHHGRSTNDISSQPLKRLEPSFSNTEHTRLKPVEAEAPRGRQYPLAAGNMSSPLRPNMQPTISLTPTKTDPLRFDNPHPDGSPHKFFNNVDPGLAHEKDQYREIGEQIRERKARLVRLEMIDRQERAAYERRQQRREQEEQDAQYSRHQHRDRNASLTEHDSPLRKSDQKQKGKSSLRHKKQIQPYDDRRESNKVTYVQVERSQNADEKQKDVEIDPQVSGLDLSDDERSSQILKNSVKNTEKSQSERQHRENSNGDQKGKHKSKDKKKQESSRRSSKSSKKSKDVLKEKKGQKTSLDMTEKRVEQSGKSKVNDSLIYSESEQLQLSQPKRMDEAMPYLDSTPDARLRNPGDMQVQELDMEHEDDDEGMDYDNHVQDMGMDDMESPDDMEGEPAIMVMPLQKPKKDERQVLAEKKMRKQIREKLVSKDHGMEPNDKKTFLKEIQKELRKLVDPTVGPEPLMAKKKLKKGQNKDKKMEVLRQLYDESQVLKINQEELKRLEWLDKSVNNSHGLNNKHEPACQKDRSRSQSGRRRLYVKEGVYQEWTNTFARSTVHWDDGKDLLDGEKAKVEEGASKLRKSPDRCCGNSPGKSHKKFCHLSSKAQPELLQDPTTGKWSKPKSYMAMDTRQLSQSRKQSRRQSQHLRRPQSAGKTYPRSQQVVSAYKKSDIKSSAKKQRSSITKKNMKALMKRKIADYSGPKGENVAIYNIDEQKMNVIKHGKPEGNQVDVIYDLGSQDDVEQNADRVNNLAKQIQQLSVKGGATEISKALSAKIKYNNQIVTLDQFLAMYEQDRRMAQEQQMQ